MLLWYIWPCAELDNFSTSFFGVSRDINRTQSHAQSTVVVILNCYSIDAVSQWEAPTDIASYVAIVTTCV